MAANGFIELLRIAKRGNKSYTAQADEATRWSGIAFEMLGQYFVAPLGEVSEVIYPPKCTPVPTAQPWVKGVANIRGRLLSVSDLPYFVSGQRSQFSPKQKVLCIAHNDHYVGVVVDQVLGIQHFKKTSFFSKSDGLNVKLQEYCQGYFHHHNQHWHVFMLNRLLKNQQYMNASTKLTNI